MYLHRLFLVPIVLCTLLSVGLSQNHVVVLDGSGDNIDLPESPSMASPSSAMTIEALIYLESYPADAANILASGNQNDYALSVRYNKKLQIHLYCPNGPVGLSFQSTQEIALNTWYHIAFTYSGTTGIMYINGAVDASVPLISCSTGSSPQSEHYSIGSSYYNGNYNFFFHGKLDEVRLWNVARSQAQIFNNMCNPLAPGDDGGLLGYWQFEGNYADATVNGNHGVPLGNTHLATENVNVCQYLNQPPVADAGPDQTIECTSASGMQVTLDGSGSTDPDNDALLYTWSINGVVVAGPSTSPTTTVTLNLGTYTIELLVDDSRGETDTDVATVIVEDTQPPVLTMPTTSITMWPPNHTYETFSLSQLVSSVVDACDANPSVSVSMVYSDEPEDAIGNGDGNTIDDIIINQGCESVQLRKERNGRGNGRVYSVTIYATDAHNNASTAIVFVTVPKSQGKSGKAVNDGPEYIVQCGVAKSSVNKVATVALPQLHQNYPNPFNPTTTIDYTIPDEGNVAIRVYDIYGRLVQTLIDERQSEGRHVVTFDALNLAGGLYLYMLKTDGVVLKRRMVLLK